MSPLVGLPPSFPGHIGFCARNCFSQAVGITRVSSIVFFLILSVFKHRGLVFKNPEVLLHVEKGEVQSNALEAGWNLLLHFF